VISNVGSIDCVNVKQVTRARPLIGCKSFPHRKGLLKYGKWRQGSGLMIPLIKGLAC
jgi:hypothetical protein